MKKILLLLICVLFFATLHAQDFIMLTNGTVIQGKVISVGTSDITYKKSDSTSALVSNIAKSDVLAIQYKNGNKEAFNGPTKNKTTTHKTDTSNFKRQFYFEAGGCLNFQFITLYYLRNEDLSNPLKVYLSPTLNLGVDLSRKISVDLEIDYQRTNYNYNDTLLTFDAYNSYGSSSILKFSNTTLSVIPNVTIRANQNRFTPYGRLGAILELVNSIATTVNAVYYENKIPTSSFEGSFTTTIPVHLGIAAAVGSDLQLANHISIFGELYFKGIIGEVFGDKGYSTGVRSAAIGLSAGLKITVINISTF